MSRLSIPAGLALSLALALPANAQDEAAPSAAIAPPAASAALSITLQSNGDIERNVAIYQCDDGQALNVQYINAAPNFLAILPVDGESHVFVTTLSASGARYVSGPYEWWSKGGEATLSDLMQEEGAPPLATCNELNGTP